MGGLDGGRAMSRWAKDSLAKHRTALSFGAVLALLGAGCLVPASSATADESQAKTYAGIQSDVSYTVYRPSTTLGLQRTDLTTVPCNGLDVMTSATFGVEGGSAGWINLQESQRGGCVDGTDGIAAYTTFPVKGGTATVKGECAEGSDCTSSTAAGVRRYAYTYVTIPASGDVAATFVAVYTARLTLKQIKRFVRGLVPAAG